MDATHFARKLLEVEVRFIIHKVHVFRWQDNHRPDMGDDSEWTRELGCNASQEDNMGQM